jgi:glycosyltransferase involved in cell wall biosynthesis
MRCQCQSTGLPHGLPNTCATPSAEHDVTSTAPGISVIVSMYNQAQFLPTLLTALSTQDCPVAYEILLCDDGSTRATQEFVCTSHAMDIRYLWQPDQGFRLSRTRNNGIRCAQGDLLVFIDADSVPRPCFLRSHWEIHREPGLLVCGGVQEAEIAESRLAAGAQALLTELPDTGVSGADKLAARVASDRPWMACVGANMSVRRSDVVLFDERFEGWGSEDRDWAYRLWMSGLKVRLLDRAVLVHLRLRHQPVEWNPIRGGDHHALVSMLRGKLYLYRKYPGDVMAPSLTVVRSCYLDRAANMWRVGMLRTDVSVADILGEFEAWLDRSVDRSA